MRRLALLAALLPLAAHAQNDVGKASFTEHCAACHQAEGTGAPGIAPSLVGTLKRFLPTEPGRHYLAQILISGMAGKIETEGHSFVGLMPSFRDDLSPEQAAATIDYVLGTFDGVAEAGAATPITPAMVKEAADKQATTADTRKLREAALAGP
jgi:mono/diheme cytochrome c family protein